MGAMMMPTEEQQEKMDRVVRAFTESAKEAKLTKQEERSVVVCLLAAIALRDDLGSDEIVQELRAAGKAMLESISRMRG